MKDVVNVIFIIKNKELKKNTLEEHLITWKGMFNNNILLLNIYI